jgi:hypothetical protein
VSDRAEDPNGTPAEVTEPLASWPEAAESPAWERIADQAQSAVPGSAEPGTAPQAAPTGVRPATEAGRSRRPTSLRDQYVQDSESVPRRKLAAPAFPSAPPVPGSRVPPPVEPEPAEEPAPVSEPETAASHGAHIPRVPNPVSLLGGRIPKDKLPTDRISMDKLPLDKLPTDKLPIGKLQTLTRQRPELGLGLAFAGGLLIATILKRLARR